MKGKAPRLSMERLDIRGSGIPGFKAIGFRQYRSARRPVPPHHHTGVLEISFLARGQQVMQTGRQRWLLRSGQVLVIPPGEGHGSASEPAEHCRLYWLNMDLRPGRSFLAAEGREAAALRRRLAALQGRALPAPPWLRESFDRVLTLHRGGEPLKRLRMLHELTRIALGLIDAGSRPVGEAVAPSIARIRQHIASHLGEALTVSDLAEMAGVAPARLILLFKRSLSLTPREYVLRQKVEGSKRLLKETTASITSVGHAMGFSSSQYYATVFRRFTGITPGDYRRVMDTGRC